MFNSSDNQVALKVLAGATTNHRMQNPAPIADVLGIRVHTVTMEQVLKILTEMVSDSHPHHIMTVNPEFVMIAQRNKEFRDVLAGTSLNLPDGIGIVLAARILGFPMLERVAGVDLVENFASIATDGRFRWFLLGSAPGVAERAAAVLQGHYPRLNICGTYAGSPDPAEEKQICERIQKASPNVLLVAFGAPQQDLWIARNLKKLNVSVAIGVGGTFDFIAGVVARAPRWAQNLGIEWLHRLIHQPWRFRRMLALPRFAMAVIRIKIQKTFSVLYDVSV